MTGKYASNKYALYWLEYIQKFHYWLLPQDRLSQDIVAGVSSSPRNCDSEGI